MVQIAEVEKVRIVQYHTGIKMHLTEQHFCYWTYECTEAHSHSTVHRTGRFYCLVPAVCSLHHRWRLLQSCRLYWRGCVDHLWQDQDHHSRQLEKVGNEQVRVWHWRRLTDTLSKLQTDIVIQSHNNCLAYWATHLIHTAFQSTPQHRRKCQEMCNSLHFDRGWYKLLQKRTEVVKHPLLIILYTS